MTHTDPYFLSVCANTDRELKKVLQEEGLGKILYVNSNCILFSFQGEFPWYMKYIPPLQNRNSCLKIFQKGFQRQKEVQDIPGVQKIRSSNFYKGVSGLFGQFLYLPGETLEEQKKKLEPEIIFSAIQQGEIILTKIHDKEILHRDIKPANLIYNNQKLSIIDFGIAVNFEEHIKDIEKGFFIGSPGFVSQDTSLYRDFYGLGMTLADMLLPSIPADNFSDKYVDSLAKNLTQIYGKLYSNYFEDLVHRKFYPLESFTNNTVYF